MLGHHSHKDSCGVSSFEKVSFGLVGFGPDVLRIPLVSLDTELTSLGFGGLGLRDLNLDS